jgi:hypothetical protein
LIAFFTGLVGRGRLSQQVGGGGLDGQIRVSQNVILASGVGFDFDQDFRIKQLTTNAGRVF